MTRTLRARRVSPRIVSCARAAQYAGVEQWTMARWLRDGTIPGARKLGSRWYVSQRALDRALPRVPDE